MFALAFLISTQKCQVAVLHRVVGVDTKVMITHGFTFPHFLMQKNILMKEYGGLIKSLESWQESKYKNLS